jgi:hypothetical protein
VDELTKLKEKEQQALANIEPETLAVLSVNLYYISCRFKFAG